MTNPLLSTQLTSVTRSLAINVYQFWHDGLGLSLQQWFEVLEVKHSSEKLSNFVLQLGHDVGAKILNLSTTSYEPFGASAALLIGQEIGSQEQSSKNPTLKERSQLAHLDASHIAVHTYFDSSEHLGQFRMEIEISTCGVPTPSTLIASVLRDCTADFAQIDFRIRGINWSEEGLPILAGGGMLEEGLTNNDLKGSGWSVPGYDISVFAERRNLYLELVRQDSNTEIKKVIQVMQET